MRYLVLSDIHSNLEALRAVVADAAGRYHRTVCCGDLVGYNADPNAVVEWTRQNCSLVVRGNHDKACAGQASLEWFHSVARQAVVWTQKTLTRENLDFLRSLPQGPLAEGEFLLVHGSPADEDEYVTTAGKANTAFEALEGRLGFFGHTHVQGGFVWKATGVEAIRDPEIQIEPNFRYLINPGSVGQPRDGIPGAPYALYDSLQGVVTYCRVDYDVGRAQMKIREARLPWELADRLSVGS